MLDRSHINFNRNKLKALVDFLVLYKRELLIHKDLPRFSQTNLLYQRIKVLTAPPSLLNVHL